MSRAAIDPQFPPADAIPNWANCLKIIERSNLIVAPVRKNTWRAIEVQIESPARGAILNV
jgi:hypothetical protein